MYDSWLGHVGFPPRLFFACVQSLRAPEVHKPAASNLFEGFAHETVCRKSVVQHR
jgi:hypothetical protein